MVRRLAILILTLVGPLALVPGDRAAAQTLPFNFTVEGRLYDNAGIPLSTTTGLVMFELLSEQSSTCVLYREQFPAIDLTSSDATAIGVFSLRVGSGTRTFPSAGVPLPAFFKTGTFSGDGNGDDVAGDCSTAINSSNHTLLRIKFRTSGVGAWETLSPDTRVTAVPTAMVADSANTLQGISASSFLLTNVSTSLSQANLENVFSNTNYSTLSALLGGGFIPSTPASAVSFNSQRLTNVADPTGAQDVATKAYADSNLAGKTADMTGVGAGVGGGKVLVWDQALAKWVAQAPATAVIGIVSGTGLLGGTITALGTLSVDVGTTGNQIVQLVGGALPAVDASLLTNVQFPVQSVAGRMGVVTLNLGDIGGLGTAAAKDYGTASGNLVELVAASKLPALEGSLLTNVNARSIQSRLVASVAPALGQVLTWNGSQWEPQGVPVSSITALTGDVTASGPGAAAATISNAAITSAKIAAGYAASRLLITDAGSGATVTYASCFAGEVMKFNVATGWGCAADANSGGTVTSITAGTGLLGGVLTTLGSFAVDVGTTAGKIVQLDGLGRLPAVDGSQLTNMPNPAGTLFAAAGVVNVSAADSGKLFKLTGLTNVNLPAAAGNSNVRFQFIRRGAARVTIFPNGAETINGKIGKILAADYSTISIVSDGTEWLITSALGAISNYSLTVQGILSVAFNGQGYLTRSTLVPGATYYYIYAATTEASGKILVTGNADMGAPNNQDVFVARFNTDGTLDNTFGTSGIYLHALLGYQQASTIKVDSSGNVVVGATFQNSSDADLTIMRLTSAGVLDPTFDSDGIRTITGPDLGYSLAYNSVGAIAIDGAGKIVLAAAVNTGVDNDFATIRLNADGSFDTSFNTTGYALTNGIGYGGWDWAASVVVDSSNNIYLCGQATGPSTTADLAIVKYTSAGVLDAGFGVAGKFGHDAAGGASAYESCSTIKLEPSSGKLIALGNGYNGSNNDIVVWRLTTVGTLDTAFAATGFHRFNGPSNAYDNSGEFAFDSSGNILVTGSSEVPSQQGNMLVYRLTPAGVLDTDFNAVGYLLHNNAAGGNGMDFGRYIQVDGNGVTVLGTSSSGASDFLTFWRLE